MKTFSVCPMLEELVVIDKADGSKTGEKIETV